MADEKFIDNMKEEIRARMQSLTAAAPKVASDFYTAAEMVTTLELFCQGESTL